MANPQIIQGTLNRLLANVVFASFPYLNVTSPFLGRDGISIAFEGETAQLIGTLTGAVTSPEPYQFATITMNILKTNVLGAVYKTQIETNTTLGSVSLIPDTLALPPYLFRDMIIQSVRDVAMNGQQAEMAVVLRGVYNINSLAFFNT